MLALVELRAVLTYTSLSLIPHPKHHPALYLLSIVPRDGVLANVGGLTMAELFQGKRISNNSATYLSGVVVL